MLVVRRPQTQLQTPRKVHRKRHWFLLRDSRQPDTTLFHASDAIGWFIVYTCPILCSQLPYFKLDFIRGSFIAYTWKKLLKCLTTLHLVTNMQRFQRLMRSLHSTFCQLRGHYSRHTFIWQFFALPSRCMRMENVRHSYVSVCCCVHPSQRRCERMVFSGWSVWWLEWYITARRFRIGPSLAGE